jgi:DNA-binding IclR family transcriptional regulator
LSQDDVLNWLKANPGLVRNHHIAKALGQNVSSIERITRSLRRWKDVDYRIVEGNRGEYRYREG